MFKAVGNFATSASAVTKLFTRKLWTFSRFAFVSPILTTFVEFGRFRWEVGGCACSMRSYLRFNRVLSRNEGKSGIKETVRARDVMEGRKGVGGGVLISGSRENSATHRVTATTNVFILFNHLFNPLHLFPCFFHLWPCYEIHTGPKSCFTPRAFTRAKGWNSPWIKTLRGIVGSSARATLLRVISIFNCCDRSTRGRAFNYSGRGR